MSEQSSKQLNIYDLGGIRFQEGKPSKVLLFDNTVTKHNLSLGSVLADPETAPAHPDTDAEELATLAQTLALESITEMRRCGVPTITALELALSQIESLLFFSQRKIEVSTVDRIIGLYVHLFFEIISTLSPSEVDAMRPNEDGDYVNLPNGVDGILERAIRRSKSRRYKGPNYPSATMALYNNQSLQMHEVEDMIWKLAIQCYDLLQSRKGDRYVSVVPEIRFSTSKQDKAHMNTLLKGILDNRIPVENIINYLRSHQVPENLSNIADNLTSLRSMIISRSTELLDYIALAQVGNQPDGIALYCDPDDSDAISIIEWFRKNTLGPVFGKTPLLSSEFTTDNENIKQLKELFQSIATGRIHIQIIEHKVYTREGAERPSDLVADTVDDELRFALLSIARLYGMVYEIPQIENVFIDRQFATILQNMSALAVTVKLPVVRQTKKEDPRWVLNPLVDSPETVDTSVSIDKIPIESVLLRTHQLIEEILNRAVQIYNAMYSQPGVNASQPDSQPPIRQ